MEKYILRFVTLLNRHHSACAFSQQFDIHEGWLTTCEVALRADEIIDRKEGTNKLNNIHCLTSNLLFNHCVFPLPSISTLESWWNLWSELKMAWRPIHLGKKSVWTCRRLSSIDRSVLSHTSFLLSYYSYFSTLSLTRDRQYNTWSWLLDARGQQTLCVSYDTWHRPLECTCCIWPDYWACLAWDRICHTTRACACHYYYCHSASSCLSAL